jgi:NTP pyrophosphatase (non-canonical NTP hydrolase)
MARELGPNTHNRERGICVNCSQPIYKGRFDDVGWEPDHDPDADPLIWRHENFGYAACGDRKIGVRFAEPGGQTMSAAEASALLRQYTEGGPRSVDKDREALQRMVDNGLGDGYVYEAQEDPDDDVNHMTKLVPRKSLAEMAEEVYNFEVSKGWQPNDNRFPESLALLHSEVSEALEAFREIGLESRSTRKPYDPLGLPKPDDAASELADVFIRLLSTWHQYFPGQSLEAEYERKMAYNQTRSQRHGGKAL